MDEPGPVEIQPPPTASRPADPADPSQEGDAPQTADPVEAVFRSDYARLVALARLLLDRQVDAEEVVQEAFARVLSARRPPAAAAVATYVRADRREPVP